MRRRASIESRVINYNQSARRRLYAAVAAGFLGAVCLIAQAYMLSQAVDRVFLKRQVFSDVQPFLLAMLILVVVRAVFIWSSDVLAQRSASLLKNSLRERLTKHLLDLGPTYTQHQNSGELVYTAVDAIEVLDQYITVYQPARLLAGLVPVLVLLVVLVLDPPTTAILLFSGPMLLLLLALIGSRTRDITERRFRELSWLSAFFLDILQGIATLKMFGRSREQIGNIRTISHRYGSTTMEVLQTAFQTALVLEFGGTVATALVAVEVSLRLMAGGLPFDRALMLLIITPEFFLPLRQMAMRYHAGTAGKAAAERIFTILDTPVTIARYAKSNLPVPRNLHIRFENVHVAYDSGKRPALRGFSLTIPHGQVIALVGATGAGKTTVANLLLRFIEPTEGIITVDNVVLSAIDLSAWRARVAWVPQLPYLFYASVADNIRVARPDASMADIIAAAKAAHAHEFIEALPQGYDTLIGERGVRLSGGQQQRLAIARAFLKDAPLLILDEATSHLDAASEEAIYDALTTLLRGRTVVIIAHRLKLAYAADCVAVLDGGRVVETGDPHLLLAHSGAYQHIVTAYEEATA